MGKIRFWINRYFGFSRGETNGFFLLLLICFLSAVAPFLLDSGAAPEQISRDQAALDSLVAQLERQGLPPAQGQRAAIIPRRPLISFNPNALSRQEWLDLGLSSYATANILKYRDRAGGFRYKEQLARIYGLPPELYRQLEPFIDLPSRASRPASRPALRRNRPYERERPPPRPRLTAFDINTADTLQLKKIRGIGPVFSRRIIRFRDKLGGFAHVGQLREVYGLPPEAADSLQKYVFVREGFLPQQIPVNTASLQQLQAHPYLGYRVARLIVAYRTQHGDFQSLDELARIHQIPAGQLEKVRPYLRL